ncbi:MAG: LOG family protein [Phycisphaerae bacterium]
MSLTPQAGKVVSVFGSNAPTAGDESYAAAREVGRRLAELGYAIANGGYGGVMEASSRGASEAGGDTIGVVCSIWSSTANRHTGRTVVTSGLLERLNKLIELGTGGYVVLPGGTGTLVELATVWELMAKGLMPRRPTVCVGGFWRPVIELMAGARPGCEELVTVAATPRELERHFPPVRGSLR